MNPLNKSKVKQHRDALKNNETIPKEKTADQQVIHAKKALGQKYDSSGADKQGYKTVPSPHSSPSIKFIPQNGMPFGKANAYLDDWYFEDENTTLVLLYTRSTVKISGQNLLDLFDQVSAYKVKEIYITDKAADASEKTVIDSITIKRNREEEL